MADKLVMDRYERAKMYVETAKTVFDHARVEAAPDWVEIYWVPARSVKHCEDCLILAVNSPYTKKSLPCTPRDGTTKCLCITTPDSRILTDTGWKAIADVCIDDMVFTHKGRWKKVLKTHRNKPNKGHIQAWIKAPTGKTVGVTSDHRFLTSKGWEEIKTIDKSALSIYTIKHEYLPNMQKNNQIGLQNRSMQNLQTDLPNMWWNKNIPSSRMCFMQYESVSKTAMGESMLKRDDLQINYESTQKGSEKIWRFIRKRLQIQKKRWTKMVFLLGRRFQETYPSISLAMDMFQWTYPGRLCHTPQEPRQNGRQTGKFGIDGVCGSLSASWRVGPESNARMDLQKVRQKVQMVCKKKSSQKKLLFSTMFRKCQNWYADMCLWSLWKKIFCKTNQWKTGKTLSSLFPRDTETILYDLTVEDDRSFIVEGLVAHNSNCKCHLMIRYKKPDDTEPVPEGIKPPGEEYKIHPDLYDKFKGDVPEFRFFLDKHTGNPKAARKEFVAAVKKAKVGFTPSNYDDPYNRRFFKSNQTWFNIQKIKEAELSIPGTSKEGIRLRKKRQDMMQNLLTTNRKLKKDGLRWIRPDGYGGYTVGPDGKPFNLLPKG